MSSFWDLVNDMAADCVAKEDSLKRCPGTVQSIVENTNGGKAVVNCMNRNLTLLNKTGEKLEVGDSVWVHYWGNLANGYIALRNGLPNSSGGGSYTISNAVAMLQTQATLYTVATDVFDVDVENSIKAKYGDSHNIIIANDIPIIVSSVNPNVFSDVYALGAGIASGLLSTERSVYGEQTQIVPAQVYTVVVGDFSTGAWEWGADVIFQYQLTDASILESICTFQTSTLRTLRRQNGEVAKFSSFTDLGLALVTSNIFAPTTDFPHGYVMCRALCIAKYDKDDNAIAVSNLSTACIYVPFKNEAEYNYAVTTLTKSEIIPSNY